MKNALEVYREAKDLTYEQLAVVLGCSKSQAHAWCAGNALPRAKAMAKIVEATAGAVTANDFYGIDTGGGEPGQPTRDAA